MVLKAESTPITKKAIIAPIAIVALQLIAYWDALRWYMHRISSTPQEALAIVISLSITAFLSYLLVQKHRKIYRLNLSPIIFFLIIYGLSYLFLPPILRLAIAFASIFFSIYVVIFGKIPSAAFIGMILLSLPIVPSLQFFLGYIARIISAYFTVILLNLNGLSVVQEGTYLVWQGKMLQFDAPCSGINKDPCKSPLIS